MKKFLIATAVAAGAIVTAVPASAQVFIGADPYGAGVQVGPFGVGVGPRFDWHDRYRDYDYYAYAPRQCRIVRERIVTPSGRVIIQRHRDCY